MTAAAVIPLLGEDVHVYAWRVKFVEQVVQLESKSEGVLYSEELNSFHIIHFPAMSVIV